MMNTHKGIHRIVRTIAQIGACLLIGSVVLAGEAHAMCMTIGTARYCYPPTTLPAGHALTVFIGRDSDGQWIAWQDAATGTCLEWDLIGDSNGFFGSTTVYGSAESDVMTTIGSSGYPVCNFPLDPPVAGAVTKQLTMFSQGGYDYLLSYITDSNVELSCWGRAQGCYFELWGPGSISGSNSHDYVVKNGGVALESWSFIMQDGSDTVNNYTSNAPSFGDCGEGTDSYSGPRNSNITSCELR